MTLSLLLQGVTVVGSGLLLVSLLSKLTGSLPACRQYFSTSSSSYHGFGDTCQM